DRQQALPGVRPHDRVAQEVGPRLGRGPLLLRRLPPAQARTHRRRARAERAGAARGPGPRRDDLPVRGRPCRRRGRLATAHGARAGCRPAPRRAGAGRDHPGRPGRGRLDRQGPHPGPPHLLGM
ncbi:MAG: Uncharacterized protein RSP_6119, partial [uncultured Frankineae bacterium]